jgi:uncharacterized membrane protein YfcA
VDLVAIAVTVVAGVAMGAINNLAGGAGVFGLMAFEYACGLPLLRANPSLRLAALCVGLFAYLGYRRSGLTIPARTWLVSLWALPGAPLGSWLALRLPDWCFWAYLTTVLALLLRQQTKRPAADAPPRAYPAWVGPLGCFVAGVHMGYAQVGVGLMATLVLAVPFGRDLMAITMAKSTLVIVTGLASVGSFVREDAIAWGPASALAVGTAFGSYHASRWATAKGTAALRRVVVGVSAVMLVYTASKLALTLAGA